MNHFLLLEESITNFLFDFGTCRFSDSMVLFFFNLFTSRHENSCNAIYRIETNSLNKSFNIQHAFHLVVFQPFMPFLVFRLMIAVGSI